MKFDRAAYTEFVEGDSNLPRLNVMRVALGSIRRIIYTRRKLVGSSYGVGLRDKKDGRWTLDIINLSTKKVVYTSVYRYADAMHSYRNNVIRIADIQARTKREALETLWNFMERAGWKPY